MEKEHYICHKLELVGGSRSILAGGALRAVHGYSEGNTIGRPRELSPIQKKHLEKIRNVKIKEEMTKKL